MVKRFLFIYFLVLLSACKFSEKKTEPSVIPQTGENNWQSVKSEDDSKPVKRHEAAFVRVANKFYLLGGRGIRPVSIYDPKTKTWSKGTEPPLELHHFQPVVYQNKIYIIAALTGGWPNETPTTHIYSYNPATDSWSLGDEIPEERRRGSTGNVLYNGKIYISCGIKNGHIGDHKNWLDSYDPNTGKWEILADAPRPRDHFQAVLNKGKIYGVAGRNTGQEPENPFGGTIAKNDVYDIDSDRWSTLNNDIPTQRAGNAAILYEDKIVVVGGESPAQEKAHTEMEALDTTTLKWQSLPGLIEGRHGTGLLIYDENLYIASGCGNRGGEPELASMEKYAK